MRVYKYTDATGKTLNDTQWGKNVTHETHGRGGLCGPGWLHCYADPLVGAFMLPLHFSYPNPRLWEAEGGGSMKKESLKMGFSRLTTLQEIPVPVISTAQRIAFAILCAKQVYRDAAYTVWADNWISGGDRSADAADDAATHAADAATHAADAATHAAGAATHAADAADYAAHAAYAATHAADAADYAAYAADYAAYAADATVNFAKIARQAMEIK